MGLFLISLYKYLNPAEREEVFLSCSIYVRAYVCACICVCMYVCMYVCMCTRMCVFT
jgi:hypothetical protein